MAGQQYNGADPGKPAYPGIWSIQSFNTAPPAVVNNEPAAPAPPVGAAKPMIVMPDSNKPVGEIGRDQHWSINGMEQGADGVGKPPRGPNSLKVKKDKVASGFKSFKSKMCAAICRKKAAGKVQEFSSINAPTTITNPPILPPPVTPQVTPQVAAASGASQQKVRFSESLVQSRKFHIGVLLAVVLNVIVLGMEIEVTSTGPLREYNEGIQPNKRGMPLKIAFLAVYFIELILRIDSASGGPSKLLKIAASPLQLLKNLDLLLLVDFVSTACVATHVITNYTEDEPVAIWGVAALKLLRVLNIITVVLPLPSIFDEPILLLRNLVAAVKTSFWTSIVLGSVIYVSSLLFTKVLGHGYPENEVIQKYWGSIPRSSLTLFAFATQQWEGPAHYLWDIEPGMVVASVIFIIVGSIAVLNLAIANIVENTLRQAGIGGGGGGRLERSIQDIGRKLDQVLTKQVDQEVRIGHLQDSILSVMAEAQKSKLSSPEPKAPLHMPTPYSAPVPQEFSMPTWNAPAPMASNPAPMNWQPQELHIADFSAQIGATNPQPWMSSNPQPQPEPSNPVPEPAPASPLHQASPGQALGPQSFDHGGIEEMKVDPSTNIQSDAANMPPTVPVTPAGAATPPAEQPPPMANSPWMQGAPAPQAAQGIPPPAQKNLQDQQPQQFSGNFSQFGLQQQEQQPKQQQLGNSWLSQMQGWGQQQQQQVQQFINPTPPAQQQFASATQPAPTPDASQGQNFSQPLNQAIGQFGPQAQQAVQQLQQQMQAPVNSWSNPSPVGIAAPTPGADTQPVPGSWFIPKNNFK